MWWTDHVTSGECISFFYTQLITLTPVATINTKRRPSLADRVTKSSNKRPATSIVSQQHSWNARVRDKLPGFDRRFSNLCYRSWQFGLLFIGKLDVCDQIPTYHGH